MEYKIYIDGNFITIPEDVYIAWNEDKDRYIFNGETLVENPDYETIKQQQRQESFNREFFNTSLGFVRRKVTMQDGSTKDFLSDLLPIISMGIQSGQPVTIITYNTPDFSKDITDWEQYQNRVAVTPQFIQECFIQLSNDFGVVV